MRILILAALVACASPSAAPLLADHTGHTLQLDFAPCRALPGAAPVYDGSFWSFPSGGSIRCGLPVEAQDYVYSWTVYGRHDQPGPVLTTACLQLLELVGPEHETPHYDVDPCGVPVDYGSGSLALQATLADDGLGIAEDAALSLVIHGAPGDKVSGVSVEVSRLH